MASYSGPKVSPFWDCFKSVRKLSNQKSVISRILFTIVPSELSHETAGEIICQNFYIGNMGNAINHTFLLMDNL